MQLVHREVTEFGAKLRLGCEQAAGSAMFYGILSRQITRVRLGRLDMTCENLASRRVYAVLR